MPAACPGATREVRSRGVRGMRLNWHEAAFGLMTDRGEPNGWRFRKYKILLYINRLSTLRFDPPREVVYAA